MFATLSKREHYLALLPDDVAPYPTQTKPGWQTDLAYARKIGVIMGIIGYEERDSLEWIRDERGQLDRILSDGECGLIDGKRCFLWSRGFRRVFDHTCEPSDADAPRPPRIPGAGVDRDYIIIARAAVAAGRAISVAQHLSVYVVSGCIPMSTFLPSRLT